MPRTWPRPRASARAHCPAASGPGATRRSPARARRRRAAARAARGRGTTPGGGSAAPRSTRRQACARRAVRREVEVEGRRQRACPQEAGDPAAARDVRLQAVDAAEEVAEVGRHVGVLAGGDVKAGRRAVAQQPQALEVGRAHRLLVPRHAPLACKPRRPRERLLAGERAVRVDVQLRVVADRLPCSVEPFRVALRVPARPSSSRAGCPARPIRRAARGSAPASTR